MTKTKSKKPLEYALRILSMRDYSEYTIREKLIFKFGIKEANETVEKLKEFNYINDLRYAENFISSKLVSGYGIYVVVRKLKEKGIDVNRGFVLTTAESRNIDLEEQLILTMKKYLAKTGDKDKISVRNKCLAYMMRRGFDIYQAEIQFERLTDESDFS